jgi:hypothetical protein
VSNEIVAILDFFPTLARAAGGTMPTDRPIDGVDQLDFFTGEREASNREHVLLFLGQRLMAVKWRHYKIHLDGLERVDGVIEDWSFPRAFNLASDPKEAGTSSGRTRGSATRSAPSSPRTEPACGSTPMSRALSPMSRHRVPAQEMSSPTRGSLSMDDRPISSTSRSTISDSAS